MKERIRYILRYIFEGDQPRSLEQRLLLTAVVVGMLISLVGVVVSFIIRSAVPVLILAVTVFFSLTLIFHLARFKNIYRPVIFPLIVISYAAFAVLWIFDGGINGSALYLGFVVLILSMIIVSERNKILVVSAFIVLTISLYLLQLFYPGLIRGFESESRRWTDNMITVIYCAFFIFLIIRFLHRNYIAEKEKAERGEERIRSIMRNSADAIFITDREGKYLYTNKAAVDLLGYTRKELKSMTIDDLSPPGKVDEHREIFTDILSRGSGFTEIELRKKDGSYVPVDLNTVLLPDGRVYGSCRNISVRRKALNELEQNEERLKRLNADKDRFISIMSHDLKGPFQNIMGLSELLKDDFDNMDNKEIKEILTIMESTSRKTYELFEDLLKWGRTQQGKMPFNPVNIDFRELANDVTELLRPKAQQKNIAVGLQAPEGLEIFADTEMIKTVLRNLLSNAIKFTDEGGYVNIAARASESGVIVSVKDNGTGIETENIPKLFDIGRTFTTEGTAKEKGTGLGLLLCKEFVEKHEGTIEVESTIGKGSVFRFFLPEKD